jgi:hypothetical protein
MAVCAEAVPTAPESAALADAPRHAIEAGEAAPVIA